VKILKTGSGQSIVKVSSAMNSHAGTTSHGNPSSHQSTSVSTGQFVPYGKLYRTVLKNGKPIQTPVVTPQSDVLPKYKSQVWQKQRQLQVTQGSIALNEKALTRKQILK